VLENATAMANLKVIDALPQLRTKIQYGIALLAILAFIFVQTKSSAPVLPRIFVFAVAPLLIAMQLIKPLKKTHQFIIILIITLTSIAFLGTGVALAAMDKTPDFQAKYDTEIDPLERKLNTRYLIDLKNQITAVKNDGDYREIILRAAGDDDAAELTKDLEHIIIFYENYLHCRRNLRCWPSSQFDTRIHDIWYTYRPIIEELRVSFWGPDFAKTLQSHAETIQPPMYLSAVRKDPQTGKTVLISTMRQG
jgi:hypothetical protein